MNKSSNTLRNSKEIRLFIGGVPDEDHFGMNHVLNTLDYIIERLSTITSIIEIVKSNRYGGFNSSSGFGFITVQMNGKLKKILAEGYIQVREHRIRLEIAKSKNQAKEDFKSLKDRKIFVGGLPKNLKGSELEKLFKRFGPIEKAYVLRSNETGKTRGFGFVIFRATRDAYNTLHQKEIILKGKMLSVKISKAEKEMTEVDNKLMRIENLIRSNPSKSIASPQPFNSTANQTHINKKNPTEPNAQNFKISMAKLDSEHIFIDSTASEFKANNSKKSGRKMQSPSHIIELINNAEPCITAHITRRFVENKAFRQRFFSSQYGNALSAQSAEDQYHPLTEVVRRKKVRTKSSLTRGRNELRCFS